MLNIQNCVYCLKIMYIKYTKLCMFFEKLCILNIQNCVYFLKFWVPFFFFLREFQPMVFAPDDSYLSSDQDTNQFLV